MCRDLHFVLFVIIGCVGAAVAGDNVLNSIVSKTISVKPNK